MNYPSIKQHIKNIYVHPTGRAHGAHVVTEVESLRMVMPGLVRWQEMPPPHRGPLSRPLRVEAWLPHLSHFPGFDPPPSHWPCELLTSSKARCALQLARAARVAAARGQKARMQEGAHPLVSPWPAGRVGSWTTPPGAGGPGGFQVVNKVGTFPGGCLNNTGAVMALRKAPILCLWALFFVTTNPPP